MLGRLRRRFRSTVVGGKATDTTGSDPRALLERTIQEAREQHRLLTESAANVIANQVHLQLRLDLLMEEYARANAFVRQALLHADQEAKKGDPDLAANLTTAARSFADRTVLLERDVASMQELLLEATAASDRAREAVRVNGANLRRKLIERERLLSQLDQATIQEQLNEAMDHLNQGVGDEVPTLDEVRDSIRRRLAVARATAEIREPSADLEMLQMERALRDNETQTRLRTVRAELGLGEVAVAGQLEAGQSTADQPEQAANTNDSADKSATAD